MSVVVRPKMISCEWRIQHLLLLYFILILIEGLSLSPAFFNETGHELLVLTAHINRSNSYINHCKIIKIITALNILKHRFFALIKVVVNGLHNKHFFVLFTNL